MVWETVSKWIDAPIIKETDTEGRPRAWGPLFAHLAAMLTLAGAGTLLSMGEGAWALVGVALIIATAALALGGSVGFLFAIPRLNPEVQAAAAAAAVKDATAQDGRDVLPDRETAAGRSRLRRLSSNNNLEKVSDWLTTMLVGVGLSQLGNINSALVGFRDFLATTAIVEPGRPAGQQAGMLPTIGPMLLIAGLMIGFVYFYVFTRVVIAPRFDDTERDMERPDRVTSRQAAEVIKTVAQGLPMESAATRNVAAPGAPSVADSLGVMFDALYQSGGYRDAIRVGEALRSSEAVNRAEYWFYLAAAWGQAYSDSQSAEDKAGAKAEVFAASRKAIQIAPSYRSRLWSISDPENYDNDLGAFRTDEEFLKIVGRIARGPEALG